MLKKLFLILTLFFSLQAEPTTPIVILGGGIAGMTAALQVSQAGLNPLVIVGPTPGGIITVSPGVENWPGDLSITGSALADKLEQQLEKRGVKLTTGTVTSVDFSRRPFIINVKNPLLPGESSVIEAKCCIIALGATPNQLQVPGETPLLYNKIFTCAPCDGLRFKDQTVAVIGGGESALIEAHYLANIAKQVIVIVRGKKFKTIQPALKENLLSRPNVKVLYQTTVQEFQDDPSGIKLHLRACKGITSQSETARKLPRIDDCKSVHISNIDRLAIVDPRDFGTVSDAEVIPLQALNPKNTLLVQGAFLAIGSRPNTDILKNSLELDPSGYILLKDGQSTSIPGIFAAGDVSDRIYKQAITAAGDATKAALEAINYISSSELSSISATAATSEITEISDLAALKTTIQSSDKPIVVYFYSPSCTPCRSFKPLYQRWSQDYSSVAHFLKINGEVCPACFDAYKVQAIPAVLIMDPRGKVTHQAAGIIHMSDIVQFLEKQKKINES